MGFFQTLRAKKIGVFLLVLLLFLYTYSTLSNAFDGDFGWHLRFGRDIVEGRSFPYTDTYSWTYAGNMWINHEWGGDVLFWILYKHLGYSALPALLSVMVTAGFLLVHYTRTKKLGAVEVFISFFCLWSAAYTLNMRISMFGPLGFALLWYTLSHLHEKNLYYFWPPLLWLWSVLHGSWVLGFIMIGIYIGGQILSKLVERFLRITTPRMWSWGTIGRACLYSVLAFAAVGINPYGAGIWHEVLSYFSFSFYKAHINEWVPSYLYPVYWQTFIVLGFVLVFLFLALRHKKLNFAELFLYLAFIFSAVQYKRNALFLSLIAVPLFAGVAEAARRKLDDTALMERMRDIRVSGFIYSVAGVCGVLLALFWINHTRFQNIWTDTELLERRAMPVKAVQFLNEKLDKPTPIFNAFSWGGYLNWMVPDALVFIDGRGTATWQRPGSAATLLEEYFDLLEEPDELLELERSPIQYILLQRPTFIRIPKPDAINQLLFEKEDMETLFNVTPTPLESDLRASSHWRSIYRDDRAEIWERIQP